jgi:hypothetical protein
MFLLNKYYLYIIFHYLLRFQMSYLHYIKELYYNILVMMQLLKSNAYNNYLHPTEIRKNN